MQTGRTRRAALWIRLLESSWTKRWTGSGTAAQRAVGVPCLEDLKARWDGGPGQPEPMAAVGTGWAGSSPPIQAILWFYELAEKFYGGRTKLSKL